MSYFPGPVWVSLPESPQTGGWRDADGLLLPVATPINAKSSEARYPRRRRVHQVRIRPRRPRP